MGSLLSIMTVGIMIFLYVLSLDHTADCPDQHGKSKTGKIAIRTLWIKAPLGTLGSKLGKAKSF